jgi:hypothetical protein
MFSGCPPPSDRDGDHVPDSTDQCPDVPGAGASQGCPDRDGDFFPDPSDRCPDAPGTIQGCPQSADGDGDRVLDTDDACPAAYGKQANGCNPFVWRFFFVNLGIKDFLYKKRSTTYCDGLPQCKTTNVTLTLSAATAKAAGIKNRRISSISVPVPTMGFLAHNISRANTKKLARLKKITLTINASVTLATGQKLEAPPKTRTIYRTRGAGQQFNSNGTDEGI